jgi:photosystem II stability/assembly factor-like uncharacterized protein
VGAGRMGHATATPAGFGGSALWKSTDGGSNWRDISDGFPSDRDTVIGQILVSTHDPDTVYVATNKKDKFIPDGSTGPIVGEGIGVYRSPDAGRTWERLSTPFSSVFNLAEDATEPGRLYASTQEGVYTREGPGQSWRLVLEHPTKAIASHPTRSGVLYAGTNKYPDYWDLLVSTDGGETWAEGNLTIQVGREPDAREYDGIDLNADYRPDFGYIMDLAVDDVAGWLYAATRGAGLWRGRLTEMG